MDYKFNIGDEVMIIKGGRQSNQPSMNNGLESDYNMDTIGIIFDRMGFNHEILYWYKLKIPFLDKPYSNWISENGLVLIIKVKPLNLTKINELIDEI